jgi:acyl carrier protein
LTPAARLETIRRPMSVDERSHEAIAAEVRDIVAEALELPAGEIRGDQELDGDLGVDSLAMIQIRVALEHELGVRAPDDVEVAQSSSIRTVHDLVELVERELRSR